MEVFDLTRGTTTGTIRVPALAGTTAQFKIRSTKTKKVNGKLQTPERIAFTYSYANQAVVRASWVVDPSDSELYIVTLSVIYTNTSTSENRTTVPFTQNESGNVLNLTVIQEAGITVQEYVLTWALPGVILPPGGGSRTVEIESYVLYSDGSKQALTPDIISKPDWVTSVDIVSKDLISKFNVTISAPTNPNVVRKGNITLKIPHNSVEGVELEIPVTQTAQITEQDITLTLKFPMENVTGALFADGETPVNSSGVGGYFSFNSMFGQFSWTFKPSVGILVNLSSPGSTKYAKPGDRVKVYQNTSASSGSGTWSYIATFTMPSKDETIKTIIL